jgi:hypothetical protein
MLPVLQEFLQGAGNSAVTILPALPENIELNLLVIHLRQVGVYEFPSLYHVYPLLYVY